MADFHVYFKMVDHSLDDVRYTMPTECTIVQATSKQEALQLFCSNMAGERYQVLAALELHLPAEVI